MTNRPSLTRLLLQQSISACLFAPLFLSTTLLRILLPSMPSPQMIEVKQTYEASFQFISAGAHSVPIPSLNGQDSWRLCFDAAIPIPIEGARRLWHAH